jgi:hypothetical protein
LHPKFYMPIFLWDVESFPNYTEKLIFAEIGTITLIELSVKFSKESTELVSLLSKLGIKWLKWVEYTVK